MGAKLGMEAKFYRNTGTYEDPVWVEIDNVKDVRFSGEKGDADVTTRKNNGFRAKKGTLKDGGIEFQMVYDTDDENVMALRTAWFQNTSVEVAMLDGEITEAGSRGVRATMEVMNFSENQALEEAITVDVTLAPSYAEHPPEDYVVGAAS
jgi:hypothetical protein